MRILVLGGTRFLGKHFTRLALERGHAVTLFNRGRTAPQALPDVAEINGDRLRNLDRLGTQSWDAVLDTCGYHPSVVAMSAQALRDRTRCYGFVSSVSVFAIDTPLIDEDARLLPLPDAATVSALDMAASPPAELYGPLKYLCETTVEDIMGAGHTLVVRPGLIVGPDDPTDRFTYWPLRIDAGGNVLAPAPPEQFVQFIDVRDLAGWILHAFERGMRGAFNVSGPSRTITMGEVIAASQRHARTTSVIHWIDEGVLAAEGVSAWTEMPLWVPPSDASVAGIANVDVARALAHGLTVRDLDLTVADTLAWARQHRTLEHLKAGLPRAREDELFQKRVRSSHEHEA